LHIRPTKESDLPDILLVEKAAFGNENGQKIADLVEGLLGDPMQNQYYPLSHSKIIRPLGTSYSQRHK
jgi:predicted N-acetyltransferase YhbS